MTTAYWKRFEGLKISSQTLESGQRKKILKLRYFYVKPLSVFYVHSEVEGKCGSTWIICVLCLLNLFAKAVWVTLHSFALSVWSSLYIHLFE